MVNNDYEQGRLDERKDWECAAGSLLIKYAEDVYTGLPVVITQVTKDTIDAFVKALENKVYCSNVFCDHGKWCSTCNLRTGTVDWDDILKVAEQLKEESEEKDV